MVIDAAHGFRVRVATHKCNPKPHVTWVQWARPTLIVLRLEGATIIRANINLRGIKDKPGTLETTKVTTLV